MKKYRKTPFLVPGINLGNIKNKNKLLPHDFNIKMN